MLCRGCRCGRTDKGSPQRPTDRSRAVWTEEGLGWAVHLMVSDSCLGPCELANVALRVTAGGDEWVGRMDGESVAAAAIGGARACKEAGRVQSLPADRCAGRFTRFATPEGSA